MSTIKSKVQRIEELLARSYKLRDSGNYQDAATLLRESLALDPTDSRVKEAIDKINEADQANNTSKAYTSCQTYVKSREEADGKEARRAVKQEHITEQNADGILDMLLERSNGLEYADSIVGSLLSLEVAQTALAPKLEQSPTTTFEQLWGLGEESLQGLMRSILNPKCWSTEDARRKAERDVLRLLLAKLLESDLSQPELAMKSTARLLAVDASQLQDIIQQDTFDVVLSHTNISNDIGIRSQATLATAKFLEAAPERGQKLLTDFVVTRVTTKKTDDLTLAFSAAGAVFPVVPSVAGPMFLTKGFVEDLTRTVESTDSEALRHATLELLSAACIDKHCREAVGKHCVPYLKKVVEENPNEQDSALAALVLTKIKESSSSDTTSSVTPIAEATTNNGNEVATKEKNAENDNTMTIFKRLSIATPSTPQQQTSIEGLAYRSTSPQVKEDLSRDKNFLTSLIKTLATTKQSGPLLFGGLTILSNLTTYPPTLSAEQKKLSELKAYANQSKPAKPDPLESDAKVTARNERVLDAGVASVIVAHHRRAQPTLLALLATITLSLAKHPKHRGKMAQQGLFDTSLALASMDLLSAPSSSDANATADTDAALLARVRRDSAFAFARLLVQVDPSLLFTRRAAGTPSIHTAIRVLDSLLYPSEVGGAADSGVDLMPTFESLRALTNIATLDDDHAAQNAITALSFNRICDELAWSKHSKVQQAAVECINNLCVSPKITEKFLGTKRKKKGPTRRGSQGSLASVSTTDTSGSTKTTATGASGADSSQETSPTLAKQRMRLLLALTGSDNVGTRRAAAGSIAGLLALPNVAFAFLNMERAVEGMLETLDEDETPMKQRAIVILQELLFPNPPNPEVVEVAIEKITMCGGREILQSLKGIKEFQMEEEIESCLKALMGEEGVRVR